MTRGTTSKVHTHVEAAPETESFELVRSIPLYIRLSDRWLMGIKDRKADLEANVRRTLAAIKTAAEASRIDPT